MKKLHQLLSRREVVRAKCENCNTWIYAGEFVLDPGNSLFSYVFL